MEESEISWTSLVFQIISQESRLTESVAVKNDITVRDARAKSAKSGEFENLRRQCGVAKIGAGDLARDKSHGGGECGAFHVRAFEICADQARFFQIRAREAGVAKIGEKKVGGFQVGFLQVGVAEIDAYQFSSFQLGAGKIDFFT